jgi:two-component sensor histidine kinase
MTAAPTCAELEQRVLMLPPSKADGAVAFQMLAAAGLTIVLCASAEELCATAKAGAAVLVLAEETLVSKDCVSDFLDQQPAWSDLPLIVLTTRRREPTAPWQMLAKLSSVRNVTLLERPMRTEMLLQAVRVALRSRDRQYQLRTSIEERESLLAQREMLLREVQHRVKNNLQMMQSLIRLSAARAPPQAEPLFTDLVGRIGAIGQLHTQIYASGNLAEIEAAAYVSGVIDQIDAAFGTRQQRVRVTRHLEPIVVDVDTAIPLGLITNELLTNAYRHAFPTGSKGFIRVELRLHAGIVELVIRDTGIGLAEGKGASSSTGLRLVEGLAKQIGGTLTTRSGSGMRATVRFPLKKRAMSSA